MAEEDCDLSAWPVLRLDQLAAIASETLERALRDAEVLLGRSGEAGPLDGYLRRQVAATAQLLRQREAQARVDRLLQDDSLPTREHPPPEKEEEDESRPVHSSATVNLLPAAVNATPPTDGSNELQVRFQLPRRSASVDAARERLRVGHIGGAGPTFVVEAVQPKRRPPAAKPVAESRDEQLQRERLARRAAALERLAVRRERRGRVIEVGG